MRILPYIFILFLSQFALAQDDLLVFTENKGQWEDPVKFKAQIPAGNLYLENNQLTYLFYNETDMERMDELHHGHIKNPQPVDSIIRLHAFQVQFVDALTPSFNPSEKEKAFANYFLGNDSSKWVGNVQKYRAVEYQELYVGIGLKFYTHNNTLKYDFLVAPHAATNQIKLNYSGADKIYLKNGHLYVETSVNTLIEHKPYAYQLIGDRKKEVPCAFQLNGHTLSFDFPEGYDPTYPLVIDPALLFASYTGATVGNWGYTSTYDEAGHLYGGGVVFGMGYPTTLGAYETNFNGGNRDVGITKFSTDGSTLIYSTYLGGFNRENPHSMVVDQYNNLVVFGTTSSFDFPVSSGAFQATKNGGYDIFVTKFNSSGTNIVGSTFLGGLGTDGLNLNAPLQYNYADEYRGEVIVDGTGNVYVASTTEADDFPTTPGVINPNFIMGDNNQNACVFKLSPNIDTLIWSTYFGGNMDDAAYSLQFDELGNLLFTGGTKSWDLPTSPGAINPTLGGVMDGYIAKINNTATNLLACTYIGTPELDQTFFVQLDTANNVYVLGQTEGVYPITPASVYNNGNSGQFIHKLSPDLSSTVFSTTFGSGSGFVDISLSAFLVNNCNYLLISGWGGSLNANYGLADYSTTNNLPITPNAIQSTTDGEDYYLIMLGEDASSLVISTYFGGDQSREHVDGGTSRFDKRGYVYQAVCAGCFGNNDFPTTPGAYSNINGTSLPGIGAQCNMGVFKLNLTALTVDAELYTDSLICPGDTSHFQNLSQGGLNYIWYFGDGTYSTEFEPKHIYSVPGTYTIMLTSIDSLACVISDTDYVEVTVRGYDITSRSDTAVCVGDEIVLWADGGENHFWSPSNYVTDPYSDTTTATIMGVTDFYVSVDFDGCTYDLEVLVDTLPNPVINLEDTILLEWGDEITLSPNSNGVNYWWSPPEGLSCYTCPNPTVKGNESSTYYLTVQNADGCFSYDTVMVIYNGVLYVPNAFTPNGDGVNDIFYASGKEIVEFNMQIFDRWGELLFESDDMDEGWNGYYRNELVKTETYVWKIKYKDIQGTPGKLYGTVTLIY